MHADTVYGGRYLLSQLPVGNDHIGNDDAGYIEGFGRRGCQNQPFIYVFCRGKEGIMLHSFCRQVSVDFIGKQNQIILFTEFSVRISSSFVQERPVGL